MVRRLRPARRSTTAACVVALTVAVTLSAASLASAGTASAASGLPVPLPSSLPAIPHPAVSVPSLPAPPISIPSIPVPSVSVPAVPSGTVPSVVSTVPVPSVGGGTPSVPGVTSPKVPPPLGSVLPSSGVTGLLGAVTGGGLPANVGGSGPGSLVGVGVNASPVATACVQAKGSGTALANVTVIVGGHNVTAPLVQALPGVLAPCPTSGIPSTGGLSASALGLVGACVRATAQPPLQASVLVLDTELIATLTAAGVPLKQVVVPCPAGVGGSAGGGPGSGHGGTGGTPAATAPAVLGSGAPGLGAPGAKAASAGTGRGGSAANCAATSPGWTTLDGQTLASVVPNNIPQTLPWILLALALLGRRRLGRAVAVVRTFRARRQPLAAQHEPLA